MNQTESFLNCFASARSFAKRLDCGRFSAAFGRAEGVQPGDCLARTKAGLKPAQSRRFAHLENALNFE